jgi:hypothetical protein
MAQEEAHDGAALRRALSVRGVQRKHDGARLTWRAGAGVSLWDAGAEDSLSRELGGARALPSHRRAVAATSRPPCNVACAGEPADDPDAGATGPDRRTEQARRHPAGVPPLRRLG